MFWAELSNVSMESCVSAIPEIKEALKSAPVIAIEKVSSDYVILINASK